MAQRPRNKFVITLLALSVLAFLSVSIIPLVSELFSSNPEETSQPNLPANSNQATLLEEQEKGYMIVLEREPDNQNALVELSKTRMQLTRLGKREPKDIIQPLEKLVSLNPENEDFSVLLAQTYVQVGDIEASAKTYRNFLEKVPTNPKALQGLVALLSQQNQYASAVELLKTTLDSNAEETDNFDRISVELLLGDVYRSQQSFAQAQSLYDRLLAASPQEYRAMVGKALVFKDQARTSDAKVWFDKATSAAPAQFKEQISQMSQEVSETEEAPPTTDAP